MTIIRESGTRTSTATINKPVGASVGDVLVAVVFAHHSADAVIDGFDAHIPLERSMDNRITMLTRVVDGSEGDSFTAAGGTIYGINMSRYSGVDIDNPVDGIPAGATSDTAIVVLDSIFTSFQGSMLVVGAGVNVVDGESADGITWDKSLSSRASHIGAIEAIRLGVADEIIANPGDTGTRTVTFKHTGGSATSVAEMLALKASVGSGTNRGARSGLLFRI